MKKQLWTLIFGSKESHLGEWHPPSGCSHHPLLYAGALAKGMRKKPDFVCVSAAGREGGR